ncbi:hypothetical protein [Dokdonella sp.]|uniref:hypothetical protein n=1 Tax=Dokdonella sp. TaxID=2291710 RepID=UPI0031C95FB9|nr:hypothetical protein [Dokdonella sp.]
MLKFTIRIALAALLFAGLAACSEKPGESAAPATATADTPDGAILRSAALLKAGDIAGLMEHSLPPAEFAAAKAEWTRDANSTPVTEEERQKFAATMQKLTAPGAEAALFAEIEPQLQAFDAQYEQQVPMYVAMGSGWLQGMVQENKDLSPEARKQAIDAINAVGEWVKTTRFTDPDAVKKVVAITVEAARAIDLHSLDQARALSFEQSMQKMRIAFLAVKKALAVYGFDLDRMLDSVKPEVISNDGKTARVRIGYTLFGAPLSGEVDMLAIDGHWYGKDAVERLKQTAAEDHATGGEPTAAGSD